MSTFSDASSNKVLQSFLVLKSKRVVDDKFSKLIKQKDAFDVNLEMCSSVRKMLKMLNKEALKSFDHFNCQRVSNQKLYGIQCEAHIV